ncbi:hypothetical protein Ngar_c18630 [Candidatus Nitrososphaera gargensis Ga9.2]|uniref:Uncharacterized protein n=1 Tax=Nitrososphaera gargensis (strain Ga9.2) TaxID=1237085 RepID=K0IG77_NITGG|nr:hypothetical protein [Candidatus Nitrososphaera gargensis]AFU58795.1 hypothetical protein Ngar_c18630 [Candidatus Nitrososphaera gargensis Ga9.2]
MKAIKANRQAQSYKSDFEQEMIRLMRENNKSLQAIDDNVRKLEKNRNPARAKLQGKAKVGGKGIFI